MIRNGRNGIFQCFLSWTLAVWGGVRRRRTQAPPDAADEAWVFRWFVLATAKSENHPAIGSGARPPWPKGSAGRWRGSPRTSGPTSCTKPRRAPTASRSSRPVRRPTGSPARTVQTRAAWFGGSPNPTLGAVSRPRDGAGPGFTHQIALIAKLAWGRCALGWKRLLP